MCRKVLLYGFYTLCAFDCVKYVHGRRYGSVKALVCFSIEFNVVVYLCDAMCVCSTECLCVIVATVLISFVLIKWHIQNNIVKLLRNWKIRSFFLFRLFRKLYILHNIYYRTLVCMNVCYICSGKQHQFQIYLWKLFSLRWIFRVLAGENEQNVRLSGCLTTGLFQKGAGK